MVGNEHVLVFRFGESDFRRFSVDLLVTIGLRARTTGLRVIITGLCNITGVEIGGKKPLENES